METKKHEEINKTRVGFVKESTYSVFSGDSSLTNQIGEIKICLGNWNFYQDRDIKALNKEEITQISDFMKKLEGEDEKK
jgi:hypothetical protein